MPYRTVLVQTQVDGSFDLTLIQNTFEGKGQMDSREGPRMSLIPLTLHLYVELSNILTLFAENHFYVYRHASGQCTQQHLHRAYAGIGFKPLLFCLQG